MIINGNVCKNGNRIYGVVGGDSPVQGDVNKAENIYVKQVEFNNRFEFPNVGTEKMLYVAKDEHKIYLFNLSTLNYEIVGSDYTEIEIIQGKI